MSNPIVSVILISYNQGEWLRESIDSVLRQTYQDWELILIDNGSTDTSPAIIEEYRAHPKIMVIRYERNSPHTVICNDGIRRARGRYISFLSSDDYYLPKKLERQVAVFEGLSDQYGVVYSAGYRLMPDGELRQLPFGLHRGNVLEALLTLPQFFVWNSPLIRRECFLRYPFNERIFMEGEGIFSKIALRYFFDALPEPLVVMRELNSSVGKEIRSNLQRCIIMYEELFRHPDFPEELQHLRGLTLGGTYRLGGWETIRRERDYRQGGDWLRVAINCNPKLLADPRVTAGLIMSSLPRPMADTCNNLLNWAVGTPVPPVAGPATPVEGHCLADREGKG